MDIAVGAVVIVHCREPREKLWGLLMRLDGVGVGLRGMELSAVEDWIRQEISGRESFLSPSSFFIPMHRVQRIDLDEDGEAVLGLAQRFEEATGNPVRDVLGGVR